MIEPAAGIAAHRKDCGLEGEEVDCILVGILFEKGRTVDRYFVRDMAVSGRFGIVMTENTDTNLRKQDKVDAGPNLVGGQPF